MVKVINFNSDIEKPLFRENRNGLWVDYGSDNLYPQYLLDIFHYRSNKHKAIIQRKVNMATGNGINKPQTQELQNFLENIWANDDIEEIAVKINYDLEIYNGFSLSIRWNKNGDKIVAVDYLPYHKVRLGVNNEKVFISPDWKNYMWPENEPAEYQKFNPLLAKQFNTQVYYFTIETTGQEFYPIPNYSSSINWIDLDYEIGNFHLSSVRNGFMPGFLINFATGIPTPEEMEQNYRDLIKEHQGTSNAGKIILTYSNGQDGKPELTPIPMNDTDERFLMLHKEVKEEIFIAHNVISPMLFGVRQEGQLGGRQEMLEALAIFQSTYIKYKQNIIEKQLNKIAKFAGVSEQITFERYTLDFDNIEVKGETTNE